MDGLLTVIPVNKGYFATTFIKEVAEAEQANLEKRNPECTTKLHKVGEAPTFYILEVRQIDSSAPVTDKEKEILESEMPVNGQD